MLDPCLNKTWVPAFHVEEWKREPKLGEFCTACQDQALKRDPVFLFFPLHRGLEQLFPGHASVLKIVSLSE